MDWPVVMRFEILKWFANTTQVKRFKCAKQTLKRLIAPSEDNISPKAVKKVDDLTENSTDTEKQIESKIGSSLFS